MNPPPNRYADQARRDMMRYNATVRPPAAPRTVPVWNLEAPRRCVIECHDDGCAVWIDDPASLNLPEGAMK